MVRAAKALFALGVSSNLISQICQLGLPVASQTLYHEGEKICFLSHRLYEANQQLNHCLGSSTTLDEGFLQPGH
ncbi:uncharacterized protein BDZ83DRAFT_607170 [Colletotrichum acutatum]|uniref:Uncharacterized protein n=1 Tax=Glomerella acutata TaxID=27357 RepID=A0AAD9CZ92_GLOAC|nr:uncharacterized protein BDZ83DRAFT_607170 [Colletotrichum acutatum]KAK1729217.1 hypothetical protein BDZ83DRAFT_607170 [Colletotrichum acutatum]